MSKSSRVIDYVFGGRENFLRTINVATASPHGTLTSNFRGELCIVETAGTFGGCYIATTAASTTWVKISSK